MVDILVCLSVRWHTLMHVLKQARNQANTQVCNQASSLSSKGAINQERDQSSLRSIKRAIKQAHNQASAQPSKPTSPQANAHHALIKSTQSSAWNPKFVKSARTLLIKNHSVYDIRITDYRNTSIGVS